MSFLSRLFGSSSDDEVDTAIKASKTEFGSVKVGANINVSNGVISVPNATGYEGAGQAGVVVIGDGIILSEGGVISIPTADDQGNAGLVKAGQNVSIIDGVISVAKASKTAAGVVQIGDNISVTNGKISVPLATSYEGAGMPGVVQIGEGIVLEKDGKISVPRADGEGNAGLVQVGHNINCSENGIISIPIASSTVPGVIKIGDNVKMTRGKLSVPLATSYESSAVPGVVVIGEGITIDKTGKISVPLADNEGNAGLVKTGGNANIEDGVITITKASKRSYGIVKVGTGITVSTDGVISVENNTVWTVLPNTKVHGGTCTISVQDGKKQIINLNTDGGLITLGDPKLTNEDSEITLEINTPGGWDIWIGNEIAIDVQKAGTFIIKWYFDGSNVYRLDPVKAVKVQ